MAKPKKILNLLIDILLAENPLAATREILKATVEEIDEGDIWEQLYLQAFKNAGEQMRDQLKVYADNDGEIGFDEQILKKVLHQELGISISTMTDFDLESPAFLSSLTTTLSKLNALVIGGHNLNDVDYEQIVGNAVIYAKSLFKQAILDDEAAFRRAILVEQQASRKDFKAIEKHLSEQMRLSNESLERIEEKIEVLFQNGPTPDKNVVGPVIPPSQAGDYFIKRTAQSKIYTSITNKKKGGVIAICGMAGIGKTELAIAIAEEISHKKIFPGEVVWLRLGGREPGMVLSDFEVQLGIQPRTDIDLRARATNIRAILAGKPRLVVLDNIQKEDFRFLSPKQEDYYLPPQSCALLATTRLHNLPGFPANSIIELAVFSERQALQMVNRIINNKTLCKQENDSLREVVKLCGFHPLALDVSARRIIASIEEDANPISAHAKRLQNVRTKLMFLKIPDADLDIEASLQVTYDYLTKEDKWRFDTLSQIRSDVFYWGVFSIIWKVGEQETLQTLRRFRDLSIIWPIQGLWKTHELWHSFSTNRLDERIKNEKLDVHELSRLHAEAYSSMSYAWGKPGKELNLTPFIPDLMAAHDYAKEIEHPYFLPDLAIGCEPMFDMLGEWDLITSWASEALDVLQPSRDFYTKDRAQLIFKLGRIAANKGEYSKARKYFLDALNLAQETESDSFAVVLKHNLGMLAEREGDIDEAETRYQQTAEEAEKIGDRYLRASGFRDLAAIKLKKGFTDEARTLSLESLKDFEYLQDKRNVTLVKHNLLHMNKEGDYSEQVQSFLNIIKELEAIGNLHEIAKARGSLANLLLSEGEYDEGEKITRLAIGEFDALGDSYFRAVSRYQLGETLYHLNRGDEGCAILAESLEIANQIGAAGLVKSIEEIISSRCNDSRRTRVQLPRGWLNDMVNYTLDALLGGTFKVNENSDFLMNKSEKTKGLDSVNVFAAFSYTPPLVQRDQLKKMLESQLGTLKNINERDFAICLIQILDDGVEALSKITTPTATLYGDAMRILVSHILDAFKEITDLIDQISLKTIAAFKNGELAQSNSVLDSIWAYRFQANAKDEITCVEFLDAISILLKENRVVETPLLHGKRIDTFQSYYCKYWDLIVESFTKTHNSLSPTIQTSINAGEVFDGIYKQMEQNAAIIIQVRPNDVNVLFKWASVLLKRARIKSEKEASILYQEAEQKFNNILQIRPDLYRVFFEWGHALYEQAKVKRGDAANELYKRAGEKFAAALEIKKDDYDSRFWWGVVLREMARLTSGQLMDELYKQAGEKFAAALEIKPGDLNTLTFWTNGIMEQSRKKSQDISKELLGKAQQLLLEAESNQKGSAAYNLACINALLKQENECKKWLEVSKQAGTLPNSNHIENDADLEIYRDTIWFKQFLAGLDESGV